LTARSGGSGRGAGATTRRVENAGVKVGTRVGKFVILSILSDP